jgi:dihydrofolate synthase / folylpolyglutamate synthase
MAELGDPQDRLPPVVHVAGTNGKGSTVAYVRAIAEAAACRVHVYTSPHLVRFNERIRVAGRLIDDAALVPILEEVEDVNAGRPITFFEVTTAAAFLAFARVPADLVVLEVGLGGRLDATNLVKHPAVSAITSISYDHMQYLGDTLTQIAREKAGIVKPGVPVVVGPQPAEVAAVIRELANAAGAKLFEHGSAWRIAPGESGLRYEGKAARALPLPVLPGRHQVENAGIAIAVAEHLAGRNFRIDDAAIGRGLTSVEWPARLQRLTRGPLLGLLRPDAELFLDGGHNEAGGAVLADWAATRRDGKPLDVVCGMLSTKQPERFLAHLAPHVRRFRAITVEGAELMLPAEAIADAARAAGMRDVKAAGDYKTAVADLAAQAEGPHRILICGSLALLCGAVLAEHG